MLYNITKVIISALLIAAIGAIAKRHLLLGALLASIPIVSVLAMVWMYVDTKDVVQITKLARSIVWLIVPSFVLFLLLPILLTKQVNFYIALTVSILATAMVYGVLLIFLNWCGVKA